MKSLLSVLLMLLVALFETTAQHLIIGSGSKVILEPGATLITHNLNLTNNGALELSPTSNFEFAGIDLVSVSGSNGITFGNLEINNSGNIEIKKTIDIAGVLDFNSGIVYTIGDELVIFDAGSSYVNAKDQSYVDGQVRKTGDTPFDFPVGKNGVFRKAGVSGLSGSDSYTCEYFDAPFWDTGVAGPGINHVSSVEYWTLNRQGTTTSTVLLSWDANSGVGAGSAEELIVARYNGSNWVSAGGNAHTGTFADGTLESDAGLTGFGSFTLGSTNSENPLPVTMLSFNALCNDGVAEVSWETASETNSDYFVLEKSRDGVNYFGLEEITAAGNSQSVLSYTSLDREPFMNTYYRLKQVDFDGVTTYYYASASGCDEDSKFWSFINNNTLTVIFYSQKSYPYDLTVYNVMGQLVWRQEGVTEAGANTFEMNSPEFQDNIFLVHLNYNNKLITQKIFSSF